VNTSQKKAPARRRRSVGGAAAAAHSSKFVTSSVAVFEAATWVKSMYMKNHD